MCELTTLHQAITATIKTAMPELATVDAYGGADSSTAMPALFHSITALRPAVDPGDGRSCILATIEARILVDVGDTQAPLRAVTLATQLAVLLRKQFWGVDFVEEANNVRAVPVVADPVLPAPVTWQVKWEQVLRLGTMQWPWPDEPGPVAFAFSPDTGPGHEADYQSPEDLS
ncbi:hypothetical protein CQ065_02075 [Pseudomonas sp. MYb187]|uniref:hypothetical protein n=1 Tax=Pseudomonas TaxID=286 RepID=UPI000CFCD709|nr:hypothetical protein [Pseudomonas sp. MYb187]PRA71460.1 hypothetical protein CQ065_02075 [Pseudomonas sp. MYb187]